MSTFLSSSTESPSFRAKLTPGCGPGGAAPYCRDFNPDVGAAGIGIAILANGNPIGIIFASILFGALKVGGTIMGQLSGIPSSITELMLGSVMVFVILAYYVREKMEEHREKAKLKKAVSG